MKQADRIALLVLAGLAALAGFGLMFSTYMLYDDEGYVLFSLKTFAESGGLYDRVFSQYGPFFFLFNQGLHALGHDFSHTAGRLITLAYWFAATGCCAALVWRGTRSTAATAAALAGVFLHLWPLINEPSHPGGMIVFVVALTAWLGARWVDRPRRLAALAGTTGAILLLIKINVGVFLLTGAALWWGLHLETPTHTRRRSLLALALLVAVTLPVALMHARWNASGVDTFILVAIASSAAITLAAWRGATPLTQVSHLRTTLVIAFLVALATAALTLAQGTTTDGFIAGWLLQPLRFPTAYLAVHEWRPGAAPMAIGSAILAVWLLARPGTRTARFLAWLRLGTATVGGLTLIGNWHLGSQAFCLSYGLSLAWIFVAPLGTADRATQSVRSWLALLLVTQALHAFPVAGSQISWGTFLWIPLAAIGAWEAAQLVIAPHLVGTHPRWRTVATFGIIALFALRCGETAWKGWQRLREGDAIGLPGTAGLRVPAMTASALRMMSVNATTHGSVLFTMPGLHSFHLWSGIPAPTSFNATHWFTLLTSAQQEEIRRRLEAERDAVVIVDPSLMDFLTAGGIATTTPLTTWLRQEFVPVFSAEPFEFWVRRGRKLTVLDAAELFETQAPGVPRYRISLTLAAPDLRHATTVELRQFVGDTSRLIQTWKTGQPENVRTLAATSQSNRAADPSATPTSIVRLHVATATFPRELSPDRLFFVVRDAAGHRLAEARMLR